MNKDRTGHVSMWPDYFPHKKRERLLAYLYPLPDKLGYEVRCENDWIFFIHSWQELKQCMFDNKLEVHTYKLLKSFLYFDDAVKDNHACVHLANSSKQVVMITARGPKNIQCKLVSSTCWGWRKEPDEIYIKALRNIYDTFDYGVHPSPGSLGTNALKSMLAPKKGEKAHRYSRPSSMLRNRLFTYGSGGRADDFSLYEEYEIAYEQDFDNHYANTAMQGVPTDGTRKFGLTGIPTDDLTIMGEFRVCFTEAWITIPNNEDSIRKFSPFYTRDKNGLSWQTRPGRYHGYYWSPVIKACIDAGYKVEIGSGWGWTHLDKFLVPFIERAIELRQHFKEQDMPLEAQMTKGLIVATLGRFGMKPYNLELISKEDKQPGDEILLDMEYVPKRDGSPVTGYYIRRKEEPNASNLTQVLYYIIAQANLALYYRCIAEEENGNTVIMTNYDSLMCLEPPTLDMTGLKLKTHHKLRPMGRRSYESKEARIRPGVKA